MMIKRIELILKGKDYNHNMGSLMHGIIMENIDSHYAQHLHEEKILPYNQALFYDIDKKAWIWRINTLTEEVWENLGIEIAKKSKDGFYSKNKKLKIEILESYISDSIKYEDIALKAYSYETNKKLSIDFLTPTTSKHNGSYDLFPKLSRLFKGTAQKISMYSNSISLNDETLWEMIDNQSDMRMYSLKTSYYGLEGRKIPAFIGKTSYMLQGTKTQIQTINLLGTYSNYTGLGAKTGLGMGACIIK